MGFWGYPILRQIQVVNLRLFCSRIFSFWELGDSCRAWGFLFVCVDFDGGFDGGVGSSGPMANLMFVSLGR